MTVFLDELSGRAPLLKNPDLTPSWAWAIRATQEAQRGNLHIRMSPPCPKDSNTGILECLCAMNPSQNNVLKCFKNIFKYTRI
jgi:hypothetical protein